MVGDEFETYYDPRTRKDVVRSRGDLVDTKKTMYVGAYDVDTGETWEISTVAETPEDALGTALRRKTWAAFLLSGHAFKFGVSTSPPVFVGLKETVREAEAPAGSASACVDIDEIKSLVDAVQDGMMATIDANSGLRSIKLGVRRIDAAIGSS